MENTVLGLHVSLALVRHCLCCCRVLMCVWAFCSVFFIFLSLILEQVRAHDRKEIQSIWFWARFNRFRCASHWTKSRIIAGKQKRICEAKWAITTQITTKSTHTNTATSHRNALHALYVWYFTHAHSALSTQHTVYLSLCVCMGHTI